ncbi:rhomboid family intramembrane serine protease [Niveibacterium sp. 24ML]|uniref:rhomboid family intramembrane serine protease n=1 Tax=Niveibacterium sp. 24ML TaxID=2985512 RepID=UPI002271691A|nr:rhomboid family intramembrane serine protease [Niveibacterium sp. 24ML]MCX9157680.1 rhomboid family intramembrane serine protease [Niveibacterium sp. 24ML]
MTTLLVVVNLLVFAWLAYRSRALMQIDSRVLILSGALYGPAALTGQAWRIVSAIYLHGGLLHVALNLFALWQVGSVGERLFGHRNFTLIYAGAGLLGSCLSLWWKPAVFSVGASGAIFGLYGALLAYLVFERRAVPPELWRELRASTVAFIGFSLFAGFAMPGIDNAAHIGGLIGGFLLGAGFAHPIDERPGYGVWLRSLSGLCAVAGLCMLLWDGAKPAGEGFRRMAAEQRQTALFADADHELTQRTILLASRMRKGEVTCTDAIAQIESELLPGRELQLQMVTALAESVPNRALLLRYAQARRNAVVALERACATGQARWLDAAANFSLQAENVMLVLRLQRAEGARSRQ